MGIIDLLSKAIGISQIVEQTTEKENNSIKELDESIIVELAKIKQSMITIEMYYPEKAEEIKQKIKELESFIEDSIEIDTNAVNEINIKYQEIQSEHEKLSKASREKFLINEVRIAYKELDNIFSGEKNSEEKIDLNRIKELEERLKNLERRKTDFVGLKQQHYLQEIINCRYRLKCCRMLLNRHNTNEFEEAPDVEKILYANILKKDVMEMYNKIKSIKTNYKWQELDISLNEQEQDIDKIVEQIGKAFIEGNETISIDIFNNSEIMNLYVKTMGFLRDKIVFLDKNIQQEKQKIETKRIEEEETKKAEEEKKKERATYKGLTEEQQKAKLEEIDSAYFDANKNCETILEYELEVAKEKGLLSDRNRLKTKGSKLVEVENEELYDLIVKLNKKNIQYGVLMDKDTHTSILVIPEEIKDIKINYGNYFYSVYKECCQHSYKIVEGTVGKSFMTYLKNYEEEPICIYYYSDRHLCYNEELYGDDFKKEINKIYEEVLNLNTHEKTIEDIKCYLEIPYKRPICPILEKLKEANIEYYFWPNEPRINKDNPTKKIFIDRNDLKKYKEKLHEEISTEEKGLIEIGLENISIGELILAGTDIPFINELQEQKKQRKEKEEQEKKLKEERKAKYISLSEQEQRQKIKEMDNKSFDTVTSYKNILLFEREVAEAKNLLNEKSGMSSEDINFMRVSKNEIYQYLLNARKRGIRISVLPDVENGDKGTIIAMPKEREIEGDINIDTSSDIESKSIYFKVYDKKMTKSFIKYMQDKKISKESLYFSDELYIYCMWDVKWAKRHIESIVKDLVNEKGKINPPEVKFYIEIPYLRPMIPILEELKNAGIEYYVPPVLEDTCKYDETKKIYMNMEDLEKYREKVHSQISNGQKGIIIIGDKGLNEADLILGETKEYLKKDIEALRE